MYHSSTVEHVMCSCCRWIMVLNKEYDFPLKCSIFPAECVTTVGVICLEANRTATTWALWLQPSGFTCSSSSQNPLCCVWIPQSVWVYGVFPPKSDSDGMKTAQDEFRMSLIQHKLRTNSILWSLNSVIQIFFLSRVLCLPNSDEWSDHSFDPSLGIRRTFLCYSASNQLSP